MLRLPEGVHGIADDILTHGTTEIEHDRRFNFTQDCQDEQPLTQPKENTV